MVNKIGHRQSSLLEMIRNGDVTSICLICDSPQQILHKARLIVRHRSEFPLKVREVIQRTLENKASKVNAQFLCHEVWLAVRRLLRGRYHTVGENRDDELLSREWRGLDSDVDTEEEVELAIRLFPNELSYDEETNCILHNAYPIHMLLTSAKAVSFVPLFAKLGAELEEVFDEDEDEDERGGRGGRGGLFSCRYDEDQCRFDDFLHHLLCNEIARGEFGAAPSAELDERSMAALKSLRERGLVTKKDIHECNLLSWLFYESDYRESTFIAERLRFLIEWDPTILKSCRRCYGGGDSLLYQYSNSSSGENWFDIRTFETIFELGMVHYPEELGFLFHKNTFQLACEKIGSQRVLETIRRHRVVETIRRVVSKQLDDTHKQKPLITKKKMSSDGVYTLIRLDPSALFTESFRKQQQTTTTTLTTSENALPSGARSVFVPRFQPTVLKQKKTRHVSRKRQKTSNRSESDM